MQRVFQGCSGNGHLLYEKYFKNRFIYSGRLSSIYIFAFFGKSRVRKPPQNWYSISVVSTLFLIIFAWFVVILNAEYQHIDRYIPLFSVSVLLYVSILWVIFGTLNSMIAESNTELIKQNVTYLQGQLKTAKESELAAKTIRHDFKHHNQNLESMLKKGELQEALRYLKQYNDSLDDAK